MRKRDSRIKFGQLKKLQQIGCFFTAPKLYLSGHGFGLGAVLFFFLKSGLISSVL